MKYSSVLLLLVSALWLSVIGGDFNFSIDPEIGSFIQKQKQGTWYGHRSGLKSAEYTALCNDSKKDDLLEDSVECTGLCKNNSIAWKNNKDHEYNIIHGEFTPKIVAHIAMKLQPYGIDTYSYNKIEYVFTFGRKDTARNNQGLLDIQGAKCDSFALDKIANNVLSALKVVKSQIEFSNKIVGILNGEVYQVTYRYRRLFRGGIVLGDVSYAEIKLDAAGKLLSVSGKWPRFIPRDEEFPAVDLESGLGYATTFYQHDFESFKVFTREDKSLVKGNLKGIALAWTKVEIADSQYVLSPCYATRTDIDLSSGEMLPHMFRFPRLAKYVKW